MLTRSPNIAYCPRPKRGSVRKRRPQPEMTSRIITITSKKRAEAWARYLRRLAMGGTTPAARPDFS